MIILAAAAGINNELGREDGRPLWDLPDEYARFRESIRGYPIIIGRKSFDVIKIPIPESLNIVVTRNKSYRVAGAEVVNSIESAIEKAQPAAKIYVIGGGGIFARSLPLAQRIEISRINASFPEATAFFPEFSAEKWSLKSYEKHEKDKRHAYSFIFQKWERKTSD